MESGSGGQDVLACMSLELLTATQCRDVWKFKRISKSFVYSDVIAACLTITAVPRKTERLSKNNNSAVCYTEIPTEILYHASTL